MIQELCISQLSLMKTTGGSLEKVWKNFLIFFQSGRKENLKNLKIVVHGVGQDGRYGGKQGGRHGGRHVGGQGGRHGGRLV